MIVQMIRHIVDAMTGRALAAAIFRIIRDRSTIRHGHNIGQIDFSHSAQMAITCIMTRSTVVMDLIVGRADVHTKAWARIAIGIDMTGVGASFRA